MMKRWLPLVILFASILTNAQVKPDWLEPWGKPNGDPQPYEMFVGNVEGAGVSTIPRSEIPAELEALPGTYTKGSDDYGNYRVKVDGSIMVCEGIFYYRITNVAAAPYYGNKIEIRGYQDYGLDTARAAADGFAVSRAFIDGGVLHKYFLVDKYGWSLTNFVNGVSGIASSIKNGNPISSASVTNRNATNNYPGSFSDCISNSQTPADIYGGAWAVAKSRGNNFAVMSIYIRSALAMLSLAQQQYSDVTHCAYNDVLPYAPKGNNRSGVLGDQDDASVTYSNPSDAYWAGTNQAGKTGSGSPFNKTTHNGQACGVADLNGNQWQIMQGLTCAATTVNISNAVAGAGIVTITTSAAHNLSNGMQAEIESVVGMTDLNNKIFTVTVTNTTTFTVVLTTAQSYTSGGTVFKGSFYTYKESVALKNITGNNTLATDAFGNNGITANYNSVGLYLVDGGTTQKFGNGTVQLLSNETSRLQNNYSLAALGFPLPGSVSGGGTNTFGGDYYLQYYRNELCALGGGTCGHTTSAGVWAVFLSSYRGGSSNGVGGRSCLYE